jgi:ADP-ribose pyrophosphatase YjhB (NUDIX family)
MPLPTIDNYPGGYRYRFCPMDATPLERHVKHERARLVCPACGWVFYPNPNIAATTVVEYEGGIVLARRALPPDAGIWHLPIGHAEFGEHPADAAAREAYEETGLQVADLRFLSYTHSPGYGDPLMWYVVFGFAGRAVSGSLTTSAEVTELQVVPLEQVPELKWSSQQQAVAAYRALMEQ